MDSAAHIDKPSLSELIRRIVTEWLQACGLLSKGAEPASPDDHQGQKRHQQANVDAGRRRAVQRKVGS